MLDLADKTLDQMTFAIQPGVVLVLMLAILMRGITDVAPR
jgi:hypothetical protein